MKIIHLINETYQVVSEDERIVYFQGSKDDCERYRMTQEIAVKDKPCPFCGSYLKYKKGQLTICNNCKAVR